MQPIDRKYLKFLPGQNKPSQEMIYVSLNKANVIKFNTNCYRMLGKPPAVYLYYCREEDAIAVEPIDSSRLPGAFDIRSSGNGSWRINASPLCRHHNILFDATQRFVAPEFEGGRLYLKLGQTITVKNRSRKRDPKPG